MGAVSSSAGVVRSMSPWGARKRARGTGDKTRRGGNESAARKAHLCPLCPLCSSAGTERPQVPNLARRFARLACREASRRHTFRDRYDGLTERYAGAVYNGTGGKRITRTEIEHPSPHPGNPIGL